MPNVSGVDLAVAALALLPLIVLLYSLTRWDRSELAHPLPVEDDTSLFALVPDWAPDWDWPERKDER